MNRHFTYLCLLFTLAGSGCLTGQQAEYEQLKAKIEAEEGEPHSDGAVSKDFDEYLLWLGIKAADREEARDLAAKCLMDGNPYWEERFLDLVELAQESGESTLWMADYLFLRIKTKSGGNAGDDWQDAVFKADYYGKSLYSKAAELSFDANYIRESVRCLMRFALADVERGYVALYQDREMGHGTQYDQDGNLLMPDMDFDILCLPRSAFHMISEGTQGVAVDTGLGFVERIRDVCEWFELYEYQEGTDLMNRFLQDFLCVDKDNPGKSLNWYLDLARKYKLEKSVKHILGFYGTLYGKVEIQEGEKKSEAPGSQLSVTDENIVLRAAADEKGNYYVDNAPLFCKCPPYPVSAVYKGDRVDSKYTGELSEPHDNYRQEKNLVIPGSGFAWIGIIRLEITERFNCDSEKQTSDISSKRLIAGDEKRTVADILIGLSDFDLPKDGSSVGAELQYISGQITVNMSEDHTIEGNAEKTECFNPATGRHNWVYPGNWSKQHETMAGQAYCDIQECGLEMVISKKKFAEKEAAADFQKQMADIQAKMQEAIKTMDKGAMEKIKGEMYNLMQGDKNDMSIPVKAALTISPAPALYPVYTTSLRKSYNVCLGDYKENTGNSDNIEMPLMNVIGAIMEGVYTREDNGNDRIDLSIEETKACHPPFGSDICPDATVTVSGRITLERRKN